MRKPHFPSHGTTEPFVTELLMDLGSSEYTLARKIGEYCRAWKRAETSGTTVRECSGSLCRTFAPEAGLLEAAAVMVAVGGDG